MAIAPHAGTGVGAGVGAHAACATMPANATVHAEMLLAPDERTSYRVEPWDKTVSVTLSSSSLA